MLGIFVGFQVGAVTCKLQELDAALQLHRSSRSWYIARIGDQAARVEVYAFMHLRGLQPSTPGMQQPSARPWYNLVQELQGRTQQLSSQMRRTAALAGS